MIDWNYMNYQDLAKFEYGRMFWKIPERRQALLQHWLDERHPHHDRFPQWRHLVEIALSSEHSPEELDELFQKQGESFRTVIREIPSVFGSFFTWKLSPEPRLNALSPTL